MNTSNHWDLLRLGQEEIALKSLQDAHAAEPNPSRIMEIGVAYLWTQRYEEAWKHFSTAIKNYPRSMSSFYGMAGTAKWCLGDFDGAVQQWNNGLKAAFSDTAGLGIRLPLLLFTASVLKPRALPKDVPEELLVRKTTDPRIKMWPGSIVEWLLRRLSDSDLRNDCRGADQSETNSRIWLAEFYITLHHYSTDNVVGARETMRILTDTSRPEWSDRKFFLARMWTEEFFIARCEAA